MNNVFYDNEEQDTLLIPVEDEQYTVITDGNKDSVVAIDDTQQTETVLIPSATQTLLAIDSGVVASKQAAPVGDYVTIKTKQTITGDKDFTGELTHNGIPVATVEDFDTSNLVDLDSYQLIDGVKVFNEQFGIRNKSNGEINLIKHINNNFLITENNGTNILNIDEQLKSMYLYNKKIATEEYVNDKAMEGGSGTVINVGGVEVSTLNFSSDPQTQLDNKVDTQYIDENLPIIVDNLVSNKGFIDKNVDNLAHYYTKTHVDNTFYDKVEVDQRIPTALSHLTDDVGYLTQETDPTVPDWAKQPNKPEYNYSEIKNKPTGVLSLWDRNPQHAIVEFDGTADKTFEIDVPGLEFEINANKDYIINLQNDVGQISDTIVDLTGKVNNKVDTSTLKSYYTSAQTDELLNNKATAVVTEAKGYTDTKISDLIGGAPGTLDTLKEIADAFAEDQEVLDALETAIGKKVDKVEGYGLSKNDYTDTDKAKLDNIAEGAEVNVQADWTVNDTSSDAYIKNKPNIPSIAGLASETYVNTQVNTLQGKIDLKADKEDLIDYATNEDLNKVAENILDNIPDISGLASENYVQSVASVIHERIDGKQDIISDLATIRSGASAGATAVQPNTLNAQVSTLQGKIDAKYTKPASGIPASDLAETYDTVTSVNNKTTTTLNNAKSYTDTKIGELIGSAPETLDTLQEVAKAIKDNADVVAGLNSAIGTKADKTTVDSLEVQVNTNAAAISNTYTKTEVGNILGDYATNNDLAGKVDKTTTINRKPLSSDIALSASDVGALPNTTVIPKLYDTYGENDDGAMTQGAVTRTFGPILSDFQNSIDEFYGAFEELGGILDAKYEKPSTGIPKTDLASDVQTSLDAIANKANKDEVVPKLVTGTEPAGRYRIYGVAPNSTEPSLLIGGTNNSDVAMYDLSGNLHTKTPLEDSHATTKLYVDTNLNSVKTELEGAIDDIRDAIGSSGTVVKVGGENQALVEFDSDPQTQLDNKIEKTTEGFKLYGTDFDGTPYNYDAVFDKALGSSIVMRNSGGQIHCNEPNSGDSGATQAVNRTYLEDQLYTKMARWTLRKGYIPVGDSNEFPTDSGVQLSELATKSEIPTDYVTTDTNQNISGQKVFDDIHTTNTVTFHNTNADYNATYKSFIYQYNDQLDISRDKEADSSDFSGVFSLKLDSKELYIGGNKMATVGNTQKQATSLRTSSVISMDYGNIAHAMKQITLHNLYGSSSSVFTIENGMLKYNGSAKRGLISLHSVVQFPSASYRDVQVNILRHNTDGTTTGIVTARHAVSSGFTTFSTAPHYVQLSAGQTYELRFASGATGYTAKFPAWQSYITIQELY